MSIETIGVIGSLVLGVAGFGFGVYQYADKKKSQKIKLRVKFESGVLTYHSGNLSEPMLFIKAANIGDRSVTLNAPHINVKHSDGGSLFTEYGAYQTLPYTLESGDSLVVWYEIKPIAKALKRHGLAGKVKLGGYYTSQVGDEFKAKPYTLDVDDWSKD